MTGLDRACLFKGFLECVIDSCLVVHFSLASFVLAPPTGELPRNGTYWETEA